MLEIKEFNDATLQAFVREADNRNTNNYPLAEAFPQEVTYDINAIYNVVSDTVRAAASITGFNSGAPLRSKGEGEKAMIELTKIQHGYYLDEVELLQFNKPRDPQERQAVIEKVFLKIADLSYGVDDIKEFLRAGLTYRGEFKYSNPVDKIEIDVKLNRPSENTIQITNKWNTPEGTPIADLISAVEQYQKTNGNKKPDYIVMNSKTFSAFKRNPELKGQIYGNSTDTRIVRDASVYELLTELGLPPIQIDDNITGIEQLDGTVKVYQNLEDGKVVLRAAQLGKTFTGPSVENNYVPGKYVQTVIEKDPSSEKTIVGEVAIPALQAINSTVLMTVL
ncbi:major capsid protein [Macrococcus psychrotolerans]|uniref:Major capsid protein n=1 Tax=Macrococcus psychrotolerans TaxID=3039389 RepID=A0AAU6RC23_9STAP